jgi:ABC-type phosphate transport system substrate-binding protein
LSAKAGSGRIQGNEDETLVRRIPLLTILLTLGWLNTAQAKDLALISNKANSVEEVAMPELIKICKGQMNKWTDGKPVTLVIRDPASPEMRIVLEKVYVASKDDVAALIAGANHNRVNHPAIIVVESDEAVVKKVESTPGAVGLVDVYAITGGVTVLKLGGKLPLEPGYALHGN